MKLKDLLEFRNDSYFDGAVQIDWFYSREKSKKVAESFVFHGKEYFGVGNAGTNKRIDTVSLVEQLAQKLEDDTSNPLTLAIADYGTGKSHFAITLGILLSGPDYMPETYQKILSNISMISKQDSKEIESLCNRKNLVIVLNGMRDFNLHAELLKAAEKSLNIYGINDEKLRKINRALETAELFFSRNYSNLIHSFETSAKKYGWGETGDELITKIKTQLLINDAAFNIINDVYADINGHEIRWDEGISATAILNQLVNEYCGINGEFDSVVILFDEFGRYLEYASGSESSKTGDSALQQIFECSQNAEGMLHVINFIQSDIKTYLQRVDNTKNISRYIGRYDVSDKYYISSNLETVFANLIHRKDQNEFNSVVVTHLNEKDQYWKQLYNDLNRWKSVSGIWADYKLFRKVIVEGIYPMHPISTFMLTQLSDYLQNRSSLTMISHYINDNENTEINKDFCIYPEELMTGDLYAEMLSAEQEGRQSSQHCIRYSNILGNYEDKLSGKSLAVLRSNLIVRILRLKSSSYDDVIKALSYCCGLTTAEIIKELDILVNEYGVLGFDDRANCFDFMEESNGAHDYKIIKNRLLATANYLPTVFHDEYILEIAGINENVDTMFANQHHINTKEWEYIQSLYDICEFNSDIALRLIEEWKSATAANMPKGRLVWLYANRTHSQKEFDRVQQICKLFEGKPIVVMLMNDSNNHLYNDLLEYNVLHTLDDKIKEKYLRHYQDDLARNKDDLSVDFLNMKKERIYFTDHSIDKFDKRLATSLTDVFERIYPDAISYAFDGYVSQKYNISKNQAKTYISILRMLLSGNINDAAIHNWPTETRNRFTALFAIGAKSSWKCLDMNSHIIPPEEKNARQIFDTITIELENKDSISCCEILAKYTMPPYGLNTDAIVLMVCVLLSNLSYCTRLLYNGSVYSIQAWKDLLIIKDDKWKAEVFNQTRLKHVDTGEINQMFVALFKRIEGNRNADNVVNLKKSLELVLQENELPEELEPRYNLCTKLLNDGVVAKREFNEKMEKISAIDSNAEPADLYPTIKALEQLRNENFSSCFTKHNYDFTQEYRDQVYQKNNELMTYISENAATYLNTFRCKDIEHILTFRNHSNKVVDLLNKVGLTEYASAVRKMANSELQNMELIKSRATFVGDYQEFCTKSKVNSYTSLTQLKEYKKDCTALQSRFDQFKKSLKNADANRIEKGLKDKQDSFDKAITAVEEEINQIFDATCEINTVYDAEQLITRIEILLRKGLNKKETDEFLELQKEVRTLKQEISRIDSAMESREELYGLADSLEKEYRDNDSDILNEDTISALIEDAKAKMELREKDWMRNHCSLGDKSNRALHEWKNTVTELPKFLSSESLDVINQLDKEADEIMKKRKIETVVHYFKELDMSERIECFEEIKKYIN